MIVEIVGKTPFRIKTLCQLRGKWIVHSLLESQSPQKKQDVKSNEK